MHLTATTESAKAASDTANRADSAILFVIAAAMVALHLATNGRFGFHRDELQVLSDALHPSWGYVALPPLTPFLERVGLALFGFSLVGLRLFAVLAQAAVIIVSGLMARDLGGKRLAQVFAAVAVALSPLPIFSGSEFQYTSFDYLWWVLIAWFVIRLLKSENPRWWLAIGAVIGIGLLTKYSILFFVAGLVGGMILTRARRQFLSAWFWAGVALAVLIFLPNLLWQFHHGFISYHFLQHIHARDVGEGRADGFLRQQFTLCANTFAIPVWIAGLILYLRDGRYRLLGWMYLISLALFVIAKGRFYYEAPAYPMLLVMGAVAGERWLATLPRRARIAIPAVFFAGVVVCGAFIVAALLPLAASGPLKQFALKHSGDLREEIGWHEMVSTVAHIRDSLPPSQQQHLGIVTGNYGEAGAIEILGPAYHLPAPISTTNSAWLRGYPDPPPDTLIVLGFSRKAADTAFTGCRLAGHNGNSQGVVNEESKDHPDIFVCGPPRKPWPVFWRDYQSFG
ncbi:MAG TPA: glycosyltransferase family 39 protein [Terracidiphilus sp.]